MSMRSVRATSFFVLAVAMLVSDASAGTTLDDPEARAILDRLQQVYARAQSYEDSGSIESKYTRLKGGGLTTTKAFSTAFTRPGRFLFTCQGDRRQQDERYIIWRDGAQVGHWSSLQPGFVPDQSFNYAVTFAARPALSDRASHTIASLLMPMEVASYGLDQMTELARLEDGTLDGDVCFRIEGESSGVHRVLWIDQSSYLVRRIEERSHNGTSEVERTTTYHPVLDRAVDEASLALPVFESK